MLLTAILHLERETEHADGRVILQLCIDKGLHEKANEKRSLAFINNR